MGGIRSAHRGVLHAEAARSLHGLPDDLRHLHAVRRDTPGEVTVFRLDDLQVVYRFRDAAARFDRHARIHRVILLRGSVAEDDEDRSGGIEGDRQRRHPVRLLIDGNTLDHARVRMPELRHLSRYAERAGDGLSRNFRLRHEIGIRRAVAAVDIAQVRVLLAAGEIGADPQFLQRVGNRAGQDALRPDFLRPRLHALVPVRITRQAGFRLGHRTDDRRARRHKPRDLTQRPVGHSLAVRKHQHPVFHPGGKREDSVLDLQRFQDRRRATVEIIAVGHGTVHPVRRVLAAEEERVGDEPPLLQQVLAARLILQPVLPLVPPRHRAFKVCAPLPHRHAGVVGRVRPRLVAVAVVDHAVDAAAIHAVSLRLDRVGIFQPLAAVGRGGERLRPRVLAPVHVRHRRGQPRVSGVHVARCARPELAHRDIDVLPVLQVVRRRVAVWFAGEEQSVLMRETRQLARVILREEIRDRAPEIPQEAFRHIRALHNVSGENRQERRDVVPATRLELLLEALCPVLRTNLVAIDQRVVQSRRRIPGERSEVTHHLFQIAREVMLHRRLAQLVALQPRAGFRGGMVVPPVTGVPDPQDRPVTRRNLPVEFPVLRHLRGQVQDRALRQHLIGARGDRVAPHVAADAENLLRQTAQLRATVNPQLAQDVGRGVGGGTLEHDAEELGARLREIHLTAFGDFLPAVETRVDGGGLERAEPLSVIRCLDPDLAEAASLSDARQADHQARRRIRLREREQDMRSLFRPAPESERDTVVRTVQQGDLFLVRRQGRGDPDARLVHRPLFRLGRRECQHRDILVKAMMVRRLRQYAGKARRPAHPRLGLLHEFHRELRRVPGAAAARPPAAVRQTDLDTQATRLLRRPLHHVEPDGGIVGDIPLRDSAMRVENLRPADSRGLHRLQIRRDSLLRDIPVHPMPPHVRFRRIRRIQEPLLQFGQGLPGGQTQ